MYAYDGTTYTGYNKTTNVSGQVTLTFPFGNYRFRADKNGTQFWSASANHCAIPGCASAAITVSVPLTVTVLDTNGSPQNALPVYAYDGNTYTNYNKTTNASGQVTLTLPFGNYRFRADKNGQQYFSGAANHCSIPSCVNTTITIPVTSGYLGGVKVLAALSLRSTSLSPNLFAGLQQSGTITTTVIRYTYDSLGRLTSADYSTGESFAYAYDAVGNRTAQTATITSTQVTNYIYDAANRLANVNGQAYTWSDNGNLLSDGATRYAYDQANRLISVTLGVTTTQYAYNGDGARLRQVVNGSPTTYTLDLATPLVQVLAQQDAGGKSAYLYGLTRIGEQQSTIINPQSPSWVYHLSDALGSVRQLVDAGGQVTLARGYTPYGEALWSQGTGQSAYGFTGEAFDVSIGLVFLRARYMDPGLGMFLSRDPWSGKAMRPGSMNGWNYAEDDPINYSDPLGWCRDATGDDPGNGMPGDPCADKIRYMMARYQVIIEPGYSLGTCSWYDIDPWSPGVAIPWTLDELKIVETSLEVMSTFLDRTKYPMSQAMRNTYAIGRVHLTDQLSNGADKLFTFPAYGNRQIRTQVPDSFFAKMDDPIGNGQYGYLIHEAFHGFDFLNGSSGLPMSSNNDVFYEELDGSSNPDQMCGPTRYGCHDPNGARSKESSKMENFADSVTVYAMEWLWLVSDRSEGLPIQILRNYKDPSTGNNALLVEYWNDGGKRRSQLDLIFFGKSSNSLTTLLKSKP